MSGSIIGHISRRTMATTFAVFVALVVLFFAITRTQVGRDELARQLETRFDNDFAGSLEIGRLTGNIRRDLYAVNVTVSDATGIPVLRIDSMVVRPQWSSLLRRRFSVHEITLFQPKIDVSWDSTNQSSLARALTRNKRLSFETTFADSVDASEDGSVLLSSSGWTLSNASLSIVGGSLKTVDPRRQDSLASTGPNGLDIRNVNIQEIDISAVIDWESSSRQVDVVQLSASLVDTEFVIEEGVAQVRLEPDRIALNGARLRTQRSTFAFKGFLDRNPDEWIGPDVPFQVEIEPSDIDFDEVARLFPAFPLRGDGQISGHLSGPLNDLVLGWASLESAGSRFEGSGTFRGLPENLDMDFSISDTRFRAEDLRILMPSNHFLKELLVDANDIQVYTSGSLNGLQSGNPVVNTRTTFDVKSTGGLVSGTLSLEGAWQDSLHHELSTRVENLNARQWTNRARLQSSVTGLLTASGFTVGQRDGATHLEGRLTDVTWTNRSADSISVSLDVTPELLSGSVSLTNGNGKIVSEGSLSLDGNRLLQATTRLDGTDVGPLLGRPDVESSVSAEITTGATLFWDRRFSASINVDVEDSYLRIADRESDVPAHGLRAEIRSPLDDEPVLEFSSDMFDVSMDGDLSLPTFVALSQAWINGFRASLDEELNKRLYPLSASDDGTAELQLSELLFFDRAADRIPESMAASSSTLEITLHDGELLSRLSPSFPVMKGEGFLRADMVWSADSLDLNVDVSSNYFSGNGTRIRNGATRAHISTAREPSILDRLSVDLQSSVDTLVLGDVEWANNSLDIAIRENQGTIAFDGDGASRLDSIIVRADLRRTSRVNLFRLTEVNVSTDEGAWELQTPSTFGLYGDATTLDELVLRYLDGGVPTVQTVRAGGTLSSSPADSLALQLDDLLLLPLSDFLDFSRPVGGFLNAGFVVSGGLAQPRFTGTLDLQQFSLDERLLGDVVFSSDYVATRPEVSVDLRIRPVATVNDPVLYGTLTPAVIVPNELHLSGDVRFPGAGGTDPGALNLDLNVDRGDLFFLQYIFPDVLENVSGFVSGSGRIAGSFYRPEFDLDVGVLDGKFFIPKTQASYTVDGSIRLDREAIRFTRLNVTDGGRGSGVITGSLLFNDYSRFTLDVNGSLTDLQIMNIGDSEELPFYGFILASGDLQLQGPLFDARLTSTNASTHPDSELFIPISEDRSETDEAFIVFEDSVGVIPDFDRLSSRSSILQRRPTSERQFLDGLSLDLNITAPQGSTVHLVIDPLLGDVINAVSTGNVQLILENDEFQVFGRLDVTSGDYQFTAGELFIRTFQINPGGSIVWNGDPVNAELDIPASYRTRASRTGLPGAEGERSGVIPLIVDLQIDGTVESPEVELSLSIDRTNQNVLGDYQALEALLNQPDRSTEYATSVLILNSFQLTTENITTDSGGQLAFNSVSQLVSAQLNRFLDAALPNVDFSFGLQGESAQDLDVTYGVAMRFLNERLIIRGEGIYQGTRSSDNVRTNDGLQGEFVVEIRIGPRVSVEVFFRRESDILESTELTNTAGLGLSYQREFESFRSLIRRDLTPLDDLEL